MNRKEEILNAVINGFHQEGFTMDLTLSQIAKKVSIGKSTLYEYFKNKEEMYTEAILLMINSSIEVSLHVEGIETYSFEKAFKLQLASLLNVACNSRMMMEMFTKNFMDKLPDSIKVDLQKVMESAKVLVTERFVLIFTKGIQEGVLKPNIEQIRIEVITSIIVGAVVRFSDKTLKLDLTEFIDAIYDSTILIGN